jgi:hypothetical protein
MTTRRDDRRKGKRETMHRKVQRSIKYRATDLSVFGLED